jgi:hypothetical protein
MDVKNFIDLHVHIGPEPIRRKFTAQSLLERERGKIRGMALKNHFFPTMPFIEQADVPADLLLVGGVALNNYVGGLNPEVIYATSRICDRPMIVWFPTVNASNFLKKSKFEIKPEWAAGTFKSRPSEEVKGIDILDRSGKLVPEARKVLRSIKDNDCILATGHISPKESQALVYAALEIGIEKIIVTHPMYQPVDMSIEMQRELGSAGNVYMEYPYALYSIDEISIESLAKSMKAVGYSKCILSSDMGQINMPSPSVGLKKYVNLLKSNGIDDDALEQMGVTNPKKLVR